MTEQAVVFGRSAAETFRRQNGGVQHLFEFPNGYGASVVRIPGISYGANQGLWEVAVLKNGGIAYDTPITDDVLGHLNDLEVEEVLNNIASLGV